MIIYSQPTLPVQTIINSFPYYKVGAIESATDAIIKTITNKKLLSWLIQYNNSPLSKKEYLEMEGRIIGVRELVREGFAI